jgi:NADPH:quinone reductase-like Zn-dependent oxidoreductase
LYIGKFATFFCIFILLFSSAGYEMSGVVDEICSTATDCRAKVGDRVIVHPSEDEDFANVGSVSINS